MNFYEFPRVSINFSSMSKSQKRIRAVWIAISLIAILSMITFSLLPLIGIYYGF